MNDALAQILSAISDVWRRRWYVAAIAWLLCGAGWTMVASLPDRFESSARVYVDMDTMLGPLMRGLAVEMNLYQQIDLMQRTLFSRPNLEKIALLTDLDLRVTTPEEKDAMLNQLRQKLTIYQQGRNLFKISYTDTDRQLAKRVVQAVLQIFVEGNLGASRKDMDSASRFLQDQIADYEHQLNAQEARINEFKRKNMGLLPGDSTYHQHLTQVQGDLERTQAFVREAEKVRDSLQKQLAEVPQFFEAPKSQDSNAMAMVSSQNFGPESDLNLRIYEMEKNVDALLMRYTPKHPDVVMARKRIAELKAQQKKEEEQKAKIAQQNAAQPVAASASDQNKVPNPLYEQIKLQLVKQEAVVAALQQREVSQKEEMAKWASLAQSAPQVETELSRLNRDYAIIKGGYSALRQRQELARLAQDMETKAQKVQFRVIDPPLLPAKPSGPNRPLFLAVVLVAGIGAGLAFAFLMGQIQSSFSTVQALRSTFNLPVLGSVTAISSLGDRWRQRREILFFALVCVGLFTAFGGLVAVEMLHQV